MVSGDFSSKVRPSVPSPDNAGASQIPSMGVEGRFKFGGGIGFNPVYLREIVRPGKLSVSALNILLVDDDQNLVTTLSHGLQKAMGNAVSVAYCYGGPEALSIMASQRFDVVVSDFNMPGMSGLEFLDTVTRDHRETIRILITAYQTDALEEEAHRRGISYITKPFGLSHMVQTIHGLIRGDETKDVTENAPRIPDTDGNVSMT